MPASSQRIAIAILSLCLAGAATADPCDAYYTFDGNLADSSGNGFDGQMIGAKGVPAKPEFVEGKYGQALKFSGKTAMRAFIDLNYDNCPQITYTAWINAQPLPSQTLLGVSQMLHSVVVGAHIRQRVRGKDISASRAVMANAGWMFVAGTWNAETRKTTLHWRTRSVEAVMGDSTRESPATIWLGALDDALTWEAKDMIVDDFRIISKALSHEQIMAIRSSGARGSAAVAATTPATATTTPAVTSCNSMSDCASGSYCAMDHACYPNSQLPMESSGTGATATGSQLGVSGPQLTTRNPGASILPLPGAGPIAPQPELVLPATTSVGLAGRWQISQSTPGSGFGDPGSSYVMTIDLHGPDTGLSGTIWIYASSILGPIDIERDFSSVTRSGNTVNFTAPNMGTFSGLVSADGTSITISSDVMGEQVVLRRTDAGGEYLEPQDAGTGDIMAGTWLRVEGGASGGFTPVSGIAMTFEFAGKDSDLSGNLTVTGSFAGNPVDKTETLLNIVMNGQTISFTSPSSGDLSGQVSADGTEMTLVVPDTAGSSMVFEKQ